MLHDEFAILNIVEDVWGDACALFSHGFVSKIHKQHFLENLIMDHGLVPWLRFCFGL